MSNREIKFRYHYLTEGTGESAYGRDVDAVILGKDGNVAAVMIDGDEWPVSPDANGECGAIAQFTGLKDRNGKEIYEGDIIQSIDSAGHPILHVIEYDHEEGRFAACYMFHERKDYPGSMRQSWLNEFAKEVIGNIHEHPHLLKP